MKEIMNIAFVTGELRKGGAQKMLSFVMNAVAGVPSAHIQLILVNENVVSYDLPYNTRVFSSEKNLLNNAKKNNIVSKVSALNQRVKFVRKTILENSTNLIYAFGSYYTLVSVLAVRSSKIKIIASERRAPQDLCKIWQFLSEYAYSKCDRVVFQLQNAKTIFSKKIQNNSDIIPNPYTGTRRIPCPPDKRKKNIVMAAARIEREKDFETGIKAMISVHAQMPEYTMDIYGRGLLLNECKLLVKEADATSYIHFHDVVSDIEEVMWDAGAFLLPSRVEGIPNILMEALGLGVPCVAADCIPGGARLLIGEDRGKLVNAGDYRQMANALVDILGSYETSLKISHNAQNVCDLFNPEKIAQMWIDNYYKVIRAS